MLVCAMVVAMGISVMAEEQAVTAGGENAKVQAEKGKHAKLIKADAEEMMNKRLERIKAKDEALYKELIALKEKDPKAFKAKMHELAKAEAEGMMN